MHTHNKTIMIVRTPENFSRSRCAAAQQRAGRASAADHLNHAAGARCPMRKTSDDEHFRRAAAAAATRAFRVCCACECVCVCVLCM